MVENYKNGKGSTARSRRAHNLEIALRFARNGVPVLLLRDKVPLVCMFGERDTDITAERREVRRARFVTEHGFEPAGIGSTTNESTIRSWWSKTDGELAAGISPGLVKAIVIDSDNKESDNADAALLRAHLAANGLSLDHSQTPIIASGRREGRHIWYKNTEGLGNGVARAVKSDWKGIGGQVVAPGSLLPPAQDGDGSARHYRPLAGSLDLVEAIRNDALPELPACLRALHGGKSAALDDTDPAVAAAIASLKNGPPSDKSDRDIAQLIQQARERQPEFDCLWRNGNDDGSAGRFGVARALLAEYGTNDFDVHDFNEALGIWDHALKGQEFGEREVARCYAKAAREFGVRSNGDSFGAVEDKEQADKQDRWAEARKAYANLRVAWTLDEGLAEASVRLHSALPSDAIPSTIERIESLLYRIQAGRPIPDTFDEAVTPPCKPRKIPAPSYETRATIRQRSRAPVRWLVDALIEQSVLFALHGGYGTGKSLVITDMAYSIAYGLPWAGRKTTRAGIIYVCGEGPAGIARRQDAWHLRQAALGNVVEDGPIELRRIQTDLFSNDTHLNQISEQIRTFADRHQIACGLVVVDTLRQVLAGGDENSARDIGAITSKFNKLRDQHGVTIGFLHHSGKDETRGASGSTAIVANVDVELIAKGKDGQGTITPGKMRDEANRVPIPYRIEAHDAGLNTEGVMERAGVAAMISQTLRPATDGNALGAVSEDDQQAVDLGDAEEPRLDPEDVARRDLVLTVVSKLAAEAQDGRVRSADILDTFNARRRMGRKDPLSRAALQIVVADLIEAGSLHRSGVGPKSRISLPGEAAGAA